MMILAASALPSLLLLLRHNHRDQVVFPFHVAVVAAATVAEATVAAAAAS